MALNTEEREMAGRRAGSNYLPDWQTAGQRIWEGCESEELCCKQSPTWEGLETDSAWTVDKAGVGRRETSVIETRNGWAPRTLKVIQILREPSPQHREVFSAGHYFAWWSDGSEMEARWSSKNWDEGCGPLQQPSQSPLLGSCCTRTSHLCWGPVQTDELHCQTGNGEKAQSRSSQEQYLLSFKADIIQIDLRKKNHFC